MPRWWKSLFCCCFSDRSDRGGPVVQQEIVPTTEVQAATVVEQSANVVMAGEEEDVESWTTDAFEVLWSAVLERVAMVIEEVEEVTVTFEMVNVRDPRQVRDWLLAAIERHSMSLRGTDGEHAAISSWTRRPADQHHVLVDAVDYPTMDRRGEETRQNVSPSYWPRSTIPPPDQLTLGERRDPIRMSEDDQFVAPVNARAAVHDEPRDAWPTTAMWSEEEESSEEDELVALRANYWNAVERRRNQNYLEHAQEWLRQNAAANAGRHDDQRPWLNAGWDGCVRGPFCKPPVIVGIVGIDDSDDSDDR